MAAASSILRSATAPKHRASSRCGSYDVPLNLLLKASAQTLDVASHVDTTVWMTYGRGSVNSSIATVVRMIPIGDKGEIPRGNRVVLVIETAQ